MFRKLVKFAKSPGGKMVLAGLYAALATSTFSEVIKDYGAEIERLQLLHSGLTARIAGDIGNAHGWPDPAFASVGGEYDTHIGVVNFIDG